MFRPVVSLLKDHRVRHASHRVVDKSMAVAPLASVAAGGQRWRVAVPTVLEGLDAALPAQVAATATTVASTERLDQSESSPPLTAQHLWSFSRVLRANRDARRTHGACVVGGASAIRRVWRQYGIQPTVVYVPDTEPHAPQWCLETSLPSLVVRCPPVQVKRSLLSAEYSDGYAAEFPCSFDTRLPPIETLLYPSTPPPSATASSSSSSGSTCATASGDLPPHALSRVSSMLVLVGLRIPSNVGLLVRAAVDLGFDRVVLVNCTDPFHEKVVRASDGTVFSPNVTLHEVHTTHADDGGHGQNEGQACVALLSAIAAQHHLLPLLAVPSQSAKSAFDVARDLHRYNRQRVTSEHDEPGSGPSTTCSPPVGPMVILGSESQGLRALDGYWSVPCQLVSLPVPNAAVDSLNVGVAGSILLNLFRPSAKTQFEKLRDAAGEVDDDGAAGDEAAGTMSLAAAQSSEQIPGAGRH